MTTNIFFFQQNVGHQFTQLGYCSSCFSLVTLLQLLLYCNNAMFCVCDTANHRRKISFQFSIEIFPSLEQFPISYIASNKTRCSNSSDKTLLILSTETGFSITPSIPTLMQFSFVILSIFPVSATNTGRS